MTSCREGPTADVSFVEPTETAEALGYSEHWTSIIPSPMNDQGAAAANFEREFALYDRLVEFRDSETSPAGATFETVYRVATTDPIDFVVASRASTVFVATTDATDTMTVERWDVSTASGSLSPPVTTSGPPSPIGVPSPSPSAGPSTPIGGTFIEPRLVRARRRCAGPSSRHMNRANISPASCRIPRTAIC